MQKNTLTINFEQKLFSTLAQIFPELTVRAFSKWMGMSSGYWSSITTQGLKVSELALRNLNDYIECRKILLPEEDTLRIRLSKIQELICREMVERFMIKTDSIDNVWDEISRAIKLKQQEEQQNYGAYPFIFLSRYR